MFLASRFWWTRFTVVAVWAATMGLPWLWACGGSSPAPTRAVHRFGQELAPPAATGAMAPNLASSSDGILLTWLEPQEKEGHRLRMARLAGEDWGVPITIVEGDRFFANWADFPSVVEGESGVLLAHWLERNGDGTYAYGVQLAISRNRGESWQRIGALHDDESPSEHGFLSLVVESGGFRTFWLDGRATLDGGAMQLRTALVTERPQPSTLLDDSVCDCCQTAALGQPEGTLVAYRDRLEGEIRDISLRRWESVREAWSDPEPIHRDGWVLEACPVNGPALAATDGQVAAAWFTAADDEPRVLAAFSADGGDTFGSPVEIARVGALGRVAAAGDGHGGVLISWIAAEDGEGAIYLRRVTPDGSRGEPLRLASASRASGVPQLLLEGERLLVVWVAATEGADDASRLVVRSVPLREIIPAG